MAIQPTEVLIDDKASGTLIQTMVATGRHGVTRRQPTWDTIMRTRRR
jgi:hypothetical protein